jgi:hypothetical protein
MLEYAPITALVHSQQPRNTVPNFKTRAAECLYQAILKTPKVNEDDVRALIEVWISSGLNADAPAALQFLENLPQAEAVRLNGDISGTRKRAIDYLAEIAERPVTAKKSKRTAKATKQERKIAEIEAAGLPIIEIRDRQLKDIVADLASAIARYNGENPTIFRGGGGLVRIEHDKDGEPILAPLSREAMQLLASKAATWTSTTEREGVRNVAPPADVCTTFLGAVTEWENVPTIDTIATAPFVDCEGKICLANGYHARARLWLSWKHQMPETTPTPDNIAAAKTLLLDTVLGEVAFADAASRAHALGLMVLPFVRQLINDLTPLHLWDANVQSSGKTFGASVCVAPFREAVPTPEKRNDEENRKELFANLNSGISHIFYDNIKGNLSDPAFATAITTGKMRGRIIGTGKMETVSTRVIWVATSNNAQLDRDAVSRCILIKLDTNVENPEGREFRRNPLQFIAANRPLVISAILTLVRAWQEQGCPSKAGKNLTRFGRWEKVIGGILESNGIDGFLQNIEEARANLDPEATAWREFVAAWIEAHGTDYVTAKELLPLAMQCEELAALVGERDGQSTRFGKMLLGKRDRVFETLKITRDNGRGKVAKWRVAPVKR